MEPAEHVQQQSVKGHLAGADIYAARLETAAVGQQFLPLLQMRNGRRHVLIQPLSLFRQGDTPIGAGDEAAAQLVLQIVHHPGDIGLAAHYGRGRPGEIFVFRHVVKAAVVLVIDRHNPALFHHKLI